MKKSVAYGLVLALVCMFAAVPVSAAPTDVSLTTAQVDSINTLYDEIVTSKQTNTALDKEMKRFDGLNGTAMKTVIAAAPNIAADVAAIDALKTANNTTRTANADDLAQLTDLNNRLTAATKAKDDKQITILGLQKSKLLATLQPVLDSLAANDKQIKSMESKLRPNATKKQQDDIKLLLTPTNALIKALWTNVKTEEKNDKDALKSLENAVKAGDPNLAIGALTAVNTAKLKVFNYKMQIYGYQIDQGDMMRAITTKVPVGLPTPNRNSNTVAVGDTVTYAFNEAVTQVDLSAVTIRDSAGTLVSGAATLSGQTLTIPHTSSLANSTQYTVLIPANAVKSTATNTPNDLITWYFTTVSP